MRKWQQTLTRMVMVGLLLIVSVPPTLSSVSVQADINSETMSSESSPTQAHENTGASTSAESAPASDSQSPAVDESSDGVPTQRSTTTESETPIQNWMTSSKNEQQLRPV